MFSKIQFGSCLSGVQPEEIDIPREGIPEGKIRKEGNQKKVTKNDPASSKYIPGKQRMVVQLSSTITIAFSYVYLLVHC